MMKTLPPLPTGVSTRVTGKLGQRPAHPPILAYSSLETVFWSQRVGHAYCSVPKSCLTLRPHTQAPLSFTISWSSSNSRPLRPWRYPTISFSAVPFSSFPASGSFPTSWLFTSGGQGIRASATVFPMNIQGWFPLGLTDWISLQSKRLSTVFSSTMVRKHQFFSTQFSLWSNSHICTWLLEKL